MAENTPLITYKITILYMLSKAEITLTDTQFTDFFLENDYLDYFQVQNALHDLTDAELIISIPTHSNRQYRLTRAGKESLSFFREKITKQIAESVEAFFSKHQIEIKEQNSMIADYYKATGGSYAVRCQAIRDDGTPVVDLTLSVPNRAQAQAVCANWRKQTLEVYSYLMDLLLQ
ncbi:MAG: DUF4364 family protein [Clostridiales bacterium]|nr:DUF4364 family protein [Clostridiales bacterium]